MLPSHKPAFYGINYKETLPSFLIQNFDGTLSVDSKIAPEHAGSKYQQIFDFGTSRQSLRGLIPQETRIIHNRLDLTILGLSHEFVNLQMTKITDIANDPNKSWKNAYDRREYRETLGSVYLELAKQVKNMIDPNKPTLFFPPKNGGIFVEDQYRKVFTDINSRFYDYRMSRIWIQGGYLMVGVNEGPNNPDIAKFKQFVISDDCIASDVSVWGTLEMIKEKLSTANAPLNEIDIVIAVSAATQAGIESLLSEETKADFGFKSIRAVVATLAHQMNEHYYLQHPDGRQVVGDMGSWTKSIE